MTDKNALDDNNPIARRNFLLGASTAVAARTREPRDVPGARMHGHAWL